ncbi:AAA family ATPase [Rubellimicrobium arenae]|uniref:AAA family ATPase n=1 Tax=Rubellimicrobium arenae TaxID=2817372 RepID=UPI001B30603D|nr:AAA family ATPase [Rubellimicrobium arenae]
MIRFVPVGQITDPLTVTLGLSGASGTGKTYSALLMARGMAEAVTGKAGAPIGYVDTENRRALHYKQAFPEMAHFDMRAVDDKGQMIGFGPERWIEVIDAAEAAKLPVLVIDSFSHAWEGVGGVLDLHAQTLDRLTRGDDSKKDARSQLAWAEVKPRYRRLVDRIVRATTNIIICTRAKPVMQDIKKGGNARPTKTRRADVPWDPAADGDLMFEMTAMVILDPKAPGCPVHQIKVADQFKAMFDPRRPMGVDLGRKMVEWARGESDTAAQKILLDRAREEARRGKDAFTAYWKGLPAASREVVRAILADCQELAARADAQARSDDSDPFAVFGAATQDEDIGPSAEERERAEREAIEQIARDRQAAGVA